MRRTIGLMMLVAGSAQAQSPLPELSDALNKAIAREEVRAAVLGLYEDGKTQVIGYGRVSDEIRQEPDGQTVFEIGSVSKVFTAMLTQTQVEAGTLAWDDPISRHLPELAFASKPVAAITLRELATHRSGLPRIPDNMSSPNPLDPYAGYEREHLLAFLASFQPESLDKEFAYSNLGAGLLGLVAADAAGLSYAEAIQRHVLAPLGMSDSAVGLPGRLAPRIAVGFSQGADMPNWDGFDALAGAGAIVSTVDDLLRFVNAHFKDGPMSSALQALREPQGDDGAGLGWQVREVDGESVYWHNGGTGGYASYLSIYPERRSAVVLLTASTAYAMVTELGMNQASGSAPARKELDLAPYAGSYKLAEGFVLAVFERDGRLYGQSTGQGAFALDPDGEHEFVFPAAKIRITFRDLDDGEAGSLTMVQAGRVTEAPRVAAELGPKVREQISIPASALADYVGRYQLAPGVVIAVEAREGQLYAQLTGQPAYPVFAYDKDQFFYRVVDAQLHFERDDNGAVRAVVLHQVGQQRAPLIRD